MIKKKFLPLHSPNERGLSSVGLERLLDRQEVGSSNLPVLTTRKRHLQRCRCLFFFVIPPNSRTQIIVLRAHSGVRGAPRAEIGHWRTAITRSARRTGIPVRLFGGGSGSGEGGAGGSMRGWSRAGRRELPPDFHADAVGVVGEAEEEGVGGGVPGADGDARRGVNRGGNLIIDRLAIDKHA